MDSFSRFQLGDLCEIVTGATPPSREPESWGNYIDFVTPSDQVGGQREVQPARRLSEIGAARLVKRVVPAQSTNLTCIGSTIGKVTMAARPCVTNQQINSLIARQGVADPRYIYYMISNWSSRLRQDAAGSATPIINKSVLSRYEFDTPPLVQQQAIGEVLGALDDKITADARLVASHEALAYAAFSGLLSDVATAPLSRVAQFVNGRAFTKDASGTGRVVIRIAELNSGIGSATVRNDIDVADIHLARPGDLLFAWSGSLTVHRWFRPEAIVNQHIFKVIPNPGYPMWLVHQLLLRKLDEFRAIAKDKATTMGHIQRRHLDEPVQVPRREEIERVHPLMEGLWFGALAAEQESLKLTELRDTLLPQFMSGRLRVKEAEKQIEAVV